MSIIKHNNINWKLYQGALVPDVAPHINIELNEEDKTFLLKESNAFFLRYTNDWDCYKETDFWYVINDKLCHIEDYSAKTRKHIRKGISECEISILDNKSFIAADGYIVYSEAMKHYNGFLTIISKENYDENILNCEDEFVCVFYQNKMIAYRQVRLMGNSAEFKVSKSIPEYQKYYPNYLMFFYCTQHYIGDIGVNYTCSGAKSLSHETNIQTLLISKFNYRKAYCRLNVVYRKDIGIVVKLLYPFKSILEKIKIKPVEKLVVLLRHEEIRRNCAK